jgi:hypothetical protein
MATISESLFPWIDEDDLPPRPAAAPVADTRPLVEAASEAALMVVSEPAAKPVSLWSMLASRWHRSGPPDRVAFVAKEAGCCPCRL